MKRWTAMRLVEGVSFPLRRARLPVRAARSAAGRMEPSRPAQAGASRRGALAWTMAAALTIVGSASTALMGQAGAPARGRGAAAPAPQRSPGAGPIIVFETVKGTFEVETYPNEAPKSVEHILALVKRNFYNGLRVHRVEPGFVVQFGDPQTRDMTKRDRWGNGGSGRAIGAAEISPKRQHKLGAVALAHAGDPRAADSQMYIALNGPARYGHMEGDYTVFGQVISGMDVVQKLQIPDIIRRVTVKAPAPGAK